MKKFITFILIGSSLLYSSCISSFATVGNYGWKVVLYHYSPDIKVQENGSDCALVKVFAAHKKAGYAVAGTGLNGSGGTDYYTTGILLDKTVAEHSITVSKNGKTVTLAFNKSSPAFIDETAALGETKVMSLAALKDEYIKDQKKKKK